MNSIDAENLQMINAYWIDELENEHVIELSRSVDEFVVPWDIVIPSAHWVKVKFEVQAPANGLMMLSIIFARSDGKWGFF